MKQKKGALLRDVVISSILFFGVMMLFVVAITSVATNYGRNDIVKSGFSDNYNKLNTLVSGPNGIDITRNSTSNPSGLQLEGNFDIAFSSMWTVFSLVWGSVDLYSGMTSGLMSDFGILIDPLVIKIIIYVLLSMLITFVIFNIISSVTRGRV